MLVPYNQHMGRDRTVAGHVALRGWLATRLDDRLGLLTRGGGAVPALGLTAAAGGGHAFQTMICFGAVIVQPALDLTFYGSLKPISEKWGPRSAARERLQSRRVASVR